MSTDAKILNKKLELIQWLSSLDDLSILEKIIALRKQETQDWWHSITQEEKDAIENGLNDADEGKLNPHSKAREIYEKWL